jgi:hypothetical protein
VKAVSYIVKVEEVLPIKKYFHIHSKYTVHLFLNEDNDLYFWKKCLIHIFGQTILSDRTDKNEVTWRELVWHQYICCHAWLRPLTTLVHTTSLCCGIDRVGQQSNWMGYIAIISLFKTCMFISWQQFPNLEVTVDVHVVFRLDNKFWIPVCPFPSVFSNL